MLVPALASAGELDMRTLLASVARPAPDSIGFVEVRYSHLLKSPLAVAGVLERGGDGSLARRVESPYRENTEVRGNDVVVAREDAKPRRFSLDRAPELQGLLSSIDAMMGGDAGKLDRYFTSTLDGTPHAWRVRLVPQDERLRRRLTEISIYGAATDPRCFIMSQPGGDASIIALGVARPDDVPHGTRGELEAWCRAGGRS